VVGSGESGDRFWQAGDRVYPVNRSIKKKITNNSIRWWRRGGDGGAVEEMMEIWPKLGEISPDPASSHQI
jgi:hypothetical protein